ncbi:hypothetical protein ID80_004881 [Salmonella enterica subsp. enterica serovar Ball]|nr:hypothetical protein [Salmonella enterica subsp. enterica serovar Ball]
MAVTVNTRLLDESIAHALYLSRYSTGIAKKMVRLLNDSDKELSARLLVALEDADADSLTVQRLNTLLRDVREFNNQTVEHVFSALGDELRDYVSYEVQYQYDLLSHLLPDIVTERYPLTGLSPHQVYASAMAGPFQGKLLSEWAGNIADDRMTRINNAVRMGYLNGDTTEQIVRKIRGSRARQYKDGVIESGRRNITAVVKTAIGHVAAVARDDFTGANDSVIRGKRWVSTLDLRTTPGCIIRDGREYTVNNRPVGHHIPWLQGPGRLHFCCRSVYTFITKTFREMGIDTDEIPEATRASMDGPAPANTTYVEWIQRQSPERQRKVLGAMRARLLRDGGMKPDEFFTDRGEWMTLEQLKETDYQAFADAGVA